MGATSRTDNSLSAQALPCEWPQQHTEQKDT
jgi:hypothetical protein